MSIEFKLSGDALWERMNRAVDKIQERLERATDALESAGIRYAIAGGNAVRAWVAQVDEAAVRTTRDIDILLHREDWEHVRDVMQAAGFIYRHVKSVDMFLDGPDAKPRDAIHIIFAGEKVRPEHELPAPSTDEAVEIKKHRTVTLKALVQMKLSSYRDKDRMHLRDMIDVGLIDTDWLPRLIPQHSQRLQQLFDDPDG